MLLWLDYTSWIREKPVDETCKGRFFDSDVLWHLHNRASNERNQHFVDDVDAINDAGYLRSRDFARACQVISDTPRATHGGNRMLSTVRL